MTALDRIERGVLVQEYSKTEGTGMNPILQVVATANELHAKQLERDKAAGPQECAPWEQRL